MNVFLTLDKLLFSIFGFNVDDEQCKLQPEQPLYGGGVIGDEAFYTPRTTGDNKSILFSPAFVLHNITQGTIYSFSGNSFNSYVIMH